MSRRGRWAHSVRAGGFVLALLAAACTASEDLVQPAPTPAASPSPLVTAVERADAPVRASPSPPSPHPIPTTPSTASPEPTAEPLPPLEGPPPQEFEPVVEQVVALRGLQPTSTLDARVVPATIIASHFAERTLANVDPDDLNDRSRLLASLRLAPVGADLASDFEAMYVRQVPAAYDIRHGIIFVGADGPEAGSWSRRMAVHEVVHALQDQAFGLGQLLDLPDREWDARLARRALMEGDAMVVEQEWAARHEPPEERAAFLAELRAQREGTPAAPAAYLQAEFRFPYVEGEAFVRALEAAGGQEAIDAAFEDPPMTTAQIMQPERYLAAQEPGQVTVTQHPGIGWSPASILVLGAFTLKEMLGPLGSDRVQVVIEGWDGGEVRHWTDGDRDAVGVAVRQRDDNAAGELCAAVPQWYATVAEGQAAATQGVMRGDRDWLAWTCDEQVIRFGLGPDESTASRIAGP